MINSADEDQLAFSEGNWSEFTLFAKSGYIRVRQHYMVKKQLPKKQNLGKKSMDNVFKILGHLP